MSYTREQARIEHLCAAVALATGRRALTTVVQWGDAQVVAMIRLQVAEYERLAQVALDSYCGMLGQAPTLDEDTVEL